MLKVAPAKPHKLAAVHVVQAWEGRTKLARRHRHKSAQRVTRDGTVRVTRNVKQVRREALARKLRIT
jgi:hypothetical protein